MAYENSYMKKKGNPGMGNPGMESEKMEYKGDKMGFDHKAHMEKVDSGLNAIMNTSNIEEAHQIAESLLMAEKKEVEYEEKDEYSKESMRDEMMKAQR